MAVIVISTDANCEIVFTRPPQVTEPVSPFTPLGAADHMPISNLSGSG
jgi:hypothetical protein